jgi:hypothetical protein
MNKQRESYLSSLDSLKIWCFIELIKKVPDTYKIVHRPPDSQKQNKNLYKTIKVSSHVLAESIFAYEIVF